MKKAIAPLQLSVMEERPFALDRLDMEFRWGNFGFRILKCHLASFPPGRVIGFHKHSEFEFHFIPRGKGKVIIEQQEFEFSAGMFYLTGPNVMHYQEADSHEGMDELCLHIDVTQIDDEQEAVHHEHKDWGFKQECQEAASCVQSLYELPSLPAEDRYNAMQYFITTYRSWLEQDAAFFTSYRGAVIQILLRAVRAFMSDQSRQAVPERDMNSYRYQLATQYIHDNYANPITLEDVAETLQVSSRQVQRIFQTNSQFSFSEYVESVRIAHVCSQLRRSQQPIEDIALEQGFTSSNYLYHVFKKRFGITPKQYREQISEHISI